MIRKHTACSSASTRRDSVKAFNCAEGLAPRQFAAFSFKLDVLADITRFGQPLPRWPNLVKALSCVAGLALSRPFTAATCHIFV